MRLINTIQNQEQAYLLSAYLHQQNIDNQLEIITNTDWGNADYGTTTCRIWIIEEDQFDQALKITETFQENPQDTRFQRQSIKTLPKETSNPAHQDIESLVVETTPGAPRQSERKQPMAPITLYIVIICSLLLMFSGFSSPEIKTLPKNIPVAPLLFSPLEKALLYDYPKAFEIIDTLVKDYGYESLDNLNALPQTGKNLLLEYTQTPYWEGIYKKIVDKAGNHGSSEWNAPLFEKIREGEIWRVLTPAFLHANIFHLFFNMIWLIVLGQQIEKRLGKGRYLLFIFLIATVSNTAQYLMSGSNFLGFSGVISGMIGFIWIRQQRAAWEGYQLEKSTLGFVFVFILMMFGLQVVSFFSEIFYNEAIPIGIGNTSHLAGALLGIILARLNFFSWR